jgi:hypothetical protein
MKRLFLLLPLIVLLAFSFVGVPKAAASSHTIPLNCVSSGCEGLAGGSNGCVNNHTFETQAMYNGSGTHIADYNIFGDDNVNDNCYGNIWSAIKIFSGYDILLEVQQTIEAGKDNSIGSLGGLPHNYVGYTWASGPMVYIYGSGSACYHGYAKLMIGSLGPYYTNTHTFCT